MEEPLEFTGRCVICGLSEKPYSATLGGPVYPSWNVPLCPWCGTDKFRENIHAFSDIIDEELAGTNIIDYKNPVFAIVTDIGFLGVEHPYLKALKGVIGVVTSHAAAKGIIATRELWGIATVRHIAPILSTLSADLKLIELVIEEQGGIKYIKGVKVPPESALMKAAATKLSGNGDRASSFSLSYVIHKSIDQTLQIIHEKGGLDIRKREGIIKLYQVLPDKGIVRIPKSFTSTLALVYGAWLLDKTEFDEAFVARFMSLRGITGKAYNEIISILTAMRPHVVQKIFDCTLQDLGYGPIYSFKFNEEYLRLRERVRERIRERGSA